MSAEVFAEDSRTDPPRGDGLVVDLGSFEGPLDVLLQLAREQKVDFVDGLGTALTPVAFLEAVVLKAHQQLVKDEVEVGVHAALTAAVKLQELASQSAENNSVADAMIQTDKIIRAVREIVPEDLWPAIVERLEAEDNHP